MSGTPSFQQLAQDALDEHHQVHFYLDQLSQTLTSLEDGISDIEPMRRLAAQIEGMKERLLEHHRHWVVSPAAPASPDSRCERQR